VSWKRFCDCGIQGEWCELANLTPLSAIQTVLSVLVKNFVFEMRDGPDTQVEVVRGILPRPRVVGEDGIGVPLRVRRYE
jgi:hypothetical protein